MLTCMSGNKKAKKIAASAITVLPISGALMGATGGIAQAAIGNAAIGHQVTSAAIGNAIILNERLAIGNAFTASVEVELPPGNPAPS
jgi:hypothetical protein